MREREREMREKDEMGHELQFTEIYCFIEVWSLIFKIKLIELMCGSKYMNYFFTPYTRE